MQSRLFTSGKVLHIYLFLYSEVLILKDKAQGADFSNSFENPPVDYYPIAFWSWNDLLDADELCKQINLFKQGGFGGVFIHSRVGLITPYMEDEWFKAVGAVIAYCKTQQLNVWLYDEDKWPSGFGGGCIPLADKTFRMKTLIARPIGKPAPSGTEKIGLPSEKLQVYKYTSLLGNGWFNGTCYIDTMNSSAVQYFLDKAYSSYQHQFANYYGNVVRAEFTDEPCTIFRGLLPAGSVPYSESLIKRFVEMHGYDPTDKLALLFMDDEDSPLFRLHYFRTINDLFENNFSKPLGNWCKEHNIDFTGHYMAENSLYDQQLWGVKVMPNYRHQSIPGVDLLGRKIDERISAKQCQSIVNQYGKKRMLSELYGVTGDSLSFQDRLWIAYQQMCLGVNLLVPHLSLYTMAGCRKRDYPQNIFYQQPWWQLNHIIHKPLARLCFALSQGRCHSEVLVIHPQESTFILWKSKWAVDSNEMVGNAFMWDMDPIYEDAKEAVVELDRQLKAMIDVLLGSQCTFDFGDETVIAECGEVVSVGDKPCVRIREMDYSVVIIPSMVTIAKTTLKLLKEFQMAGGVVMHCGKSPKYLDGLQCNELEEWLELVPSVELSDLSDCIHEAVKPIVELIEGNPKNMNMFWTHMRSLDNGDYLVYLVNLDRVKSFDAKIKFNGLWLSVCLLDEWKGTKSKICSQMDNDGLTTELSFAPAESRLLLLSQRISSSGAISLVEKKTIEIIDIERSNWQIVRLDDNALTLDYAYWCEGADRWFSEPMPVVSIQQRLNELKYTGPLTLRYPVQVGRLKRNCKIHLVLEHPERYQIFINGIRVEYTGLPFWRDIRWLPIDVTDMLSTNGENIIELHCEQFKYGDIGNINDMFARYGTEIEAVYLVGDFAVSAKGSDEKPVSPLYKEWGLPPIKVQCFHENSFCIVDSYPLAFGDTTTQGLPFYAGRLRMRTKLPSITLNNCEKVLLKIGRLDAAVAEVAIEGQTIDYIINPSVGVDITQSVIAGKSRDLTITLYGTLRNLLGPHHHIDGELPQVGPGHFFPTFKNNENPDWSLLRWTNKQEQPMDWKDRYCMVSFGDIGFVRLYFY
jgi:hypothetical protein